jgi:predicted AlkP superfamily pyrophosphatase or phosphodiesterase
MKKVCALCLIFILLLFCLPSCLAADKQPKLLVVLVIDQFRYDYTLRFRSDYHAGLSRLLEHGAVFADALHSLPYLDFLWRRHTPRNLLRAGHDQ